MNTMDVLRYGHHTMMDAIEDLPADAWEQPGACGVWSVKDIFAHLASFERVLVDILQSLLQEDIPTPVLERFITDYEQFNDREVQIRQDQSPQAVLEEYQAYHAQAMGLLAQIPPKLFQCNGVLPWYGPDYDLDDFLVYTYYGHKREHSAQILAFRDRIAAGHTLNAVG